MFRLRPGHQPNPASVSADVPCTLGSESGPAGLQQPGQRGGRDPLPPWHSAARALGACQACFPAEALQLPRPDFRESAGVPLGRAGGGGGGGRQGDGLYSPGRAPPGVSVQGPPDC